MIDGKIKSWIEVVDLIKCLINVNVWLWKVIFSQNGKLPKVTQIEIISCKHFFPWSLSSYSILLRSTGMRTHRWWTIIWLLTIQKLLWEIFQSLRTNTYIGSPQFFCAQASLVIEKCDLMEKPKIQKRLLCEEIQVKTFHWPSPKLCKQNVTSTFLAISMKCTSYLLQFIM